MYLVIDPRDDTYVFTHEDPRLDGCQAAVMEDIELEGPVLPQGWRPGDPDREPYLGRSPHVPTQFRIFDTSYDCQLAGFEPLGRQFVTVHRWQQYAQRTASTP